MEWMLMPYRRYADFSGRSGRKEYWMYALLIMIVYAICAGLMFAGGLGAMLGSASTGVAPPPPGPLFYVGVGALVLFGLVSLVPMVAVVVRRFHDRNLSGWWYLGVIVASLIPWVGYLVQFGVLILFCLPGTPGPNRFGRDPRDPTSAAVFA